MIITLVAAMDERNGIGRHGQLPWHLSDDLKHFRRLTLGHHVLMGRKTYDSFGSQMPGRTLIVLSRSEDFRPARAVVQPSLEASIEFARAAGKEELFVIGGAQVFAQALPLAQRFHLTRVHTNSKADTFFPPIKMADWQLFEQRNFRAGPKNDHDFNILHLEKTEP